MKKAISLCCLLLLFTGSFPAHGQPGNDKQSPRLNSLHLALEKSENDSLRLSVLIELIVYYWESNLDSSLYYIDESISIAKKLNYRLDEGKLLGIKADFYNRKGLYAKSLDLHLESLNILNDPKISGGIGKFWKVYYENENYREIQLLVGADITRSFSLLFESVGNYEKALVMSLQAKAVMKKFDWKFGLFLMNLNISTLYLRLGKLDSAMMTIRESSKKEPNRIYSYWDGVPSQLIGVIYFYGKEYEKSIPFLLDAIRIHSENNNLRNLSQSKNSLARIYLVTGNLQGALKYASEAIVNASAPGYVGEEIIIGYMTISKTYRAMNKRDSAYHYLFIATSLQDSLRKIKEQNISKFNIALLDENLRNRELEKKRIAAENRRQRYILFGALGLFSIIALLLYRNNRHKQRSNRQLVKQKKELENTLAKLKATQSLLIQSEKMASLGELTAGIAHEIQNPLNFVNNFSEVNTELIAEMKQEIDNGNYKEVKTIAQGIEENEQKINHHGKRADSIVKGMLQHSRSSNSVKEPTDINALANEYLRLSYHGLRAKENSFNATLKTDFDESIGNINVIPQDIGRVILNLINNAFYAVNEKKKEQPEGFEAIVAVSTKKVNGNVEVTVKDNGNGIPQKVYDKIFQPFFTTKPTGQGTGLGLSLSYDIVKAHGGELRVETKEGKGAAFIIQLPIV